MKRPSENQFDTAVEWLLNNEGEGEEGEACKAVAAWLEAQEQERKLRSAARTLGVTPARLRKKLAGREL